MLSEKLTQRDGYDVELVSGQAHACDIVIKKLNCPDVRVECKNHGETNNEKVRAKEVSKFQNDLLGLNTHGIFVSLNSGIVGKGEIELEQLPNGCFAVYLANNNFDVGIISDMVYLLHRLDHLTRKSDDKDDETVMIKVSPESMVRARLYLKDFASKLSKTKTHLKESIALLSEVSFDLIERVLLGQAKESAASHLSSQATPLATQTPSAPLDTDENIELSCSVCGRACKSVSGLARHMSVHRQS